MNCKQRTGTSGLQIVQGISQAIEYKSYRLANIFVSARCINEIVHGKRSIYANMHFSTPRYFRLSECFGSISKSLDTTLRRRRTGSKGPKKK